MKKLLYVLLDGVGDRPDKALDGLTPLESARTPFLDALASQGVSGLVHPAGEGISPESDIAVFSMLGYEFGEDYFGRGAVEVVGLDLDFRSGDLALRANFATMGKEWSIVDRRVGRDLTDAEAEELAKAIQEGVRLPSNAELQFQHTIGHRAVLVIRVLNKRLSTNISNTDPAYVKVGGMGVAREGVAALRLEGARALDDDPSSILAAELVNEFTERAIEVLKNHLVNRERRRRGRMPANVILLRDAGNTQPVVQGVGEKYGLRFASIVDMPVERGIAKITGMAEHRAGGPADYETKARTALELLKTYDAVYVHIKGPDEPGHDGLAGEKRRIIEEIDARFFSIIESGFKEGGFALSLSADHSTPCQLKSHSSDPVPLLITGAGVKGDGTKRFTESDARAGSLGTLKGPEVLKRTLAII